MKVLDMTIESNCAEVDARRIKFLEQSLSDAAKEARLSLKSTKKEEKEENINLENQLYVANIAD